jgi:hypothetical protein
VIVAFVDGGEAKSDFSSLAPIARTLNISTSKLLEGVD